MDMHMQCCGAEAVMPGVCPATAGGDTSAAPAPADRAAGARKAAYKIKKLPLPPEEVCAGTHGVEREADFAATTLLSHIAHRAMQARVNMKIWCAMLRA